MHERLTYRETKERRSDYDDQLARLNSVVEGERNHIADGAVYVGEVIKKTLGIVSMTGFSDSYEEKAAEHLRQAHDAIAEKVAVYIRETVIDMNGFIEDYPDRFYLDGIAQSEPLPLRNLIVVGEGESSAIGMEHGENRIVFSEGTYQLLVDSRIVES